METYVEEGQTVVMTGVTRTVKPGCPEPGNGYWVCVTHDLGLHTNFARDSHLGRSGHRGVDSEHQLLWWCFAHGPEVP